MDKKQGSSPLPDAFYEDEQARDSEADGRVGGPSPRYTYAAVPIDAQKELLAQAFPSLGHKTDYDSIMEPLVRGAEERFLVAPWEKVGSSYKEAVWKVLEALVALHGTAFNFDHILDDVQGDWDDPYDPPEWDSLRHHHRTTEALKRLRAKQPGTDLIVLQAQLGNAHQGRSPRRSNERLSANEFGLGTFELGCILLTHPLRMDVDSGNQRAEIFSLGDRMDARKVPYWTYGVNHSAIEIYTLEDTYFSSDLGSATAFLVD